MGAAAPIGAGIQAVGVVGQTMAQLQANRTQRALIDSETRAKESEYRRSAAMEMSSNLAKAGATGVSVSSGSPLLQALNNAKQAELNARMIRRGGEIQSDIIKQQTPYIYLGAAAQGGSIMSNFMARRQ